MDPQENIKIFYTIGFPPKSFGCPAHIKYLLCESEEHIRFRTYLLLFMSEVHLPVLYLKALELISKKHVTSRVDCYGCETRYFILMKQRDRRYEGRTESQEQHFFVK